ncbi:MAG: SGNH/GDSL hydrolase family protein [Ginsengibacter sp.]
MRLLILILFLPSFLNTGFISSDNKPGSANKISCISSHQNINTDTTYLAPVLAELRKKWPDNKIINLVFHGHSVPAGYFKTPAIHTFQAYPMLVLKKVTDSFPTASINCIRTAIGGENAEQGAKRFDSTVLSHHPDVLFIDYALNDRSIGVERAQAAWESMIQKALDQNIKVVVLTPTPDLNENILSDDAPLEKFSEMIRMLAEKYHVALVDSYQVFKTLVADGADLKTFMAQPNHINQDGHKLVANEIGNLFGLK